jgi:hypothetical protein
MAEFNDIYGAVSKLSWDWLCHIRYRQPIGPEHRTDFTEQEANALIVLIKFGSDDAMRYVNSHLNTGPNYKYIQSGNLIL